MTSLHYPLSWPSGKPWTERRTTSPYRVKVLDKIKSELLRELKLLKAKNVIVSTNIEIRLDGIPYTKRRPPSNPGVTVHFDLAGDPRVFALDRWDKVEHNMHGIALHIASLRAITRTGVASLEQIFAGHKALPEVAGETNFQIWHDVLQVPADCGFEAARTAFRGLVKIHHPDQGGETVQYQRVLKAWRMAQQLLDPAQPA